MAAGAEEWNALNIQILADLFQVKKKPDILFKSLILSALRLKLMPMGFYSPFKR